MLETGLTAVALCDKECDLWRSTQYKESVFHTQLSSPWKSGENLGRQVSQSLLCFILMCRLLLEPPSVSH